MGGVGWLHILTCLYVSIVCTLVKGVKNLGLYGFCALMRMSKNDVPVYWFNTWHRHFICWLQRFDPVKPGIMDLGSPVLRAPSSYKPLGKCLSQHCTCDLLHALGWSMYRSYAMNISSAALDWVFILSLPSSSSPHSSYISLSVPSGEVPTLLCQSMWKLCLLGFICGELRRGRKTSPVLIRLLGRCVSISCCLHFPTCDFGQC